MKPKLYILCGPPGSGKTSFAIEAINYCHNKLTYISRDEIRFSLLNNDDDYFDKEKEVWKEFIKRIQSAINRNDEIIIVDATHLSPISRERLITNIKGLTKYYVYFLNFITPLAICLKNNNKRQGRAKVPSDVLRRMYYTFEKANTDEIYDFDYGVVNIEWENM